MRMLLAKSSEQLRTEFTHLANDRDVARLLDVKYSQLIYNVRHLSEQKRYHYFEVPKARGGSRRISAPNANLKLIQHKLLQVLEAVYQPKPSAHGFVRGRSPVTNAVRHRRRRFVLNVDLKDFFPSINFGRVRGLFMAKPYSLPASVATLLAQILCNENTLPQGAPTSPIVSNMICRKLDSNLQILAQRCGVTYTRYCDDITLSTSSRIFPTELCERNVGGVTVGGRLRKIIEDNGFEINPAKVALYERVHRQEVTGLVTNRKVNVNRRFVRQVRAMLHAWRRHGLAAAAKEFFALHDRKRREMPADEEQTLFRRVVRGKIEFIGHVRGKADAVFQRFDRDYSKLAGDQKVRQIPERWQVIFDSLWVLKRSTEQIGERVTGSAFMVSGVGLVTCDHVIKAAGGARHLRALRWQAPQKLYELDVIRRDDIKDLCILGLKADDDFPGLPLSTCVDLEPTDEVLVCGFPNYVQGEEPSVYQAHVTTRRTYREVTRFLVNVPIYSGMSGGPVLREFEVVGIAAYGGRNAQEAGTTENHVAICIDEIHNLGSLSGN